MEGTGGEGWQKEEGWTNKWMNKRMNKGRNVGLNPKEKRTGWAKSAMARRKMVSQFRAKAFHIAPLSGAGMGGLLPTVGSCCLSLTGRRAKGWQPEPPGSWVGQSSVPEKDPGRTAPTPFPSPGFVGCFRQVVFLLLCQEREIFFKDARPKSQSFTES